MPFFLTLTLFINGGTWATYSIIVRDLFMGVSSGTGFVFGAIQLFLYSLYYKRTPYESDMIKKSHEVFNPTINDHEVSKVKLEEYCKQSQDQLV
eukprot:c7400_g1_i1 orf=108-389(+)